VFFRGEGGAKALRDAGVRAGLGGMIGNRRKRVAECREKLGGCLVPEVYV
jgi:hypothetical protein